MIAENIQITVATNISALHLIKAPSANVFTGERQATAAGKSARAVPNRSYKAEGSNLTESAIVLRAVFQMKTATGLAGNMVRLPVVKLLRRRMSSSEQAHRHSDQPGAML
jgi:hypothetical protein